MARILIVEDDPEAQVLVQRALGGDHRLEGAASVAEAERVIERTPIELAIVDLGLPDGDGFSICSQLRDRGGPHVPVLFLTSSSQTRDKVMAFQIGADDYVEKPFDPIELRARVEARLRRAQADRPSRLQVGELILDALRYSASVRRGAELEEIELTRNEFKLLHHLASHAGEVVTRASVLAVVWSDVAVSPRTVDTHVSNLRRKLGSDHVSLEAVRGVGYRLRPAQRALHGPEVERAH